MSDASLRAAHRDWLAHSAPEDYHRYVRERGRAGFYGTPAPDPAAAHALLAAWPRYKGVKKGQFRPAKGITYKEADRLIGVYYTVAGWLPKIYLKEREPVPPTHYEASYGALPKGFPLERDPNWQPIQYGALISPDFSYWLGSLGVRTAIFLQWDEGAAPAFSAYISAVGRGAHWSSHDVDRWELGKDDWSGSVDKKVLAQRLLEAALRVENPFHPNPPRCDYDRVAFSDSQRAGKKRQAYFTGDGRRTVHFGAQGYEDYTMHQDPERRRRYLERHGRGREDWDRCDTPGSLSRWVLWGDSTSRGENEHAFKRRFALKNPVSDRDRYRFVHACPGSTAEDISRLRASERQITRQTFAAKVGPDQWEWLQNELGYDRYLPISSADWQIPYFKGVYRGVPAVFLEWSGFEYIFTLDGDMGPSADPGFVNTDLRARNPALPRDPALERLKRSLSGSHGAHLRSAICWSEVEYVISESTRDPGAFQVTEFERVRYRDGSEDMEPIGHETAPSFDEALKIAWEDRGPLEVLEVVKRNPAGGARLRAVPPPRGMSPGRPAIMRWRRNPDEDLRRLERAWANEGSVDSARAYLSVLKRSSRTASSMIDRLDSLWDTDWEAPPRGLVELIWLVSTGSMETDNTGGQSRVGAVIVPSAEPGGYATLLHANVGHAPVCLQCARTASGWPDYADRHECGIWGWGEFGGDQLVHLGLRSPVRYPIPGADQHAAGPFQTTQNTISGGHSTEFAVPQQIAVLWSRAHGGGAARSNPSEPFGFELFDEPTGPPLPPTPAERAYAELRDLPVGSVVKIGRMKFEVTNNRYGTIAKKAGTAGKKYYVLAVEDLEGNVYARQGIGGTSDTDKSIPPVAKGRLEKLK